MTETHSHLLFVGMCMYLPSHLHYSAPKISNNLPTQAHTHTLHKGEVMTNILEHFVKSIPRGANETHALTPNRNHALKHLGFLNKASPPFCSSGRTLSKKINTGAFFHRGFTQTYMSIKKQPLHALHCVSIINTNTYTRVSFHLSLRGNR